MRAPSTAPAPALTPRHGAGAPRALGALLPDPTCPKQNPKAEGEKAPEPGNPRTKLDPHTSPRTMRAREQPIPRRPPCPAPLPRGAPRPRRHQGDGRRLRTPTRAARPRVRREGARHKAPRAPGGMEGGRGRGAPAAPSRTVRGLLRAGGASQARRCVRLAVPPGSRGRAGAAPRPPPPLTCGQSGTGAEAPLHHRARRTRSASRSGVLSRRLHISGAQPTPAGAAQPVREPRSPLFGCWLARSREEAGGELRGSSASQSYGCAPRGGESD